MFILECASGPGTLGLHLDEAKDLLSGPHKKIAASRSKPPSLTRWPLQLAGRRAVTKTLATRDAQPVRHPGPVQPALGGSAPVLSARPRASALWLPCSQSGPHQTSHYLETGFAGLASYRLTAKRLAEVLPVGRPLPSTVLRRRGWGMLEMRLLGRASLWPRGFCGECRTRFDAAQAQIDRRPPGNRGLEVR